MTCPPFAPSRPSYGSFDRVVVRGDVAGQEPAAERLIGTPE
ncbi:MAG: hypothetical protein ACRDSP_16040 [Pseudonocardiaceae bacterium]